MKPNTFFKLPIDKKELKEFLEYCMSIAEKVWADELDCKKSYARQPTDRTPEEVLKMGLEIPSNFVFVLRNGYTSPNYFETGLSTLTTHPYYYLWITLSVEDGLKVIEKYNLQQYYGNN